MKRNVAEPDSTYRGTGDSDEIAALRKEMRDFQDIGMSTFGAV